MEFIDQRGLSIWEAVGRLSGGGAETQVRLLSSELVQRGHNIKLLYVFKNNDAVSINPKVDVCFIARKSKWKWWEIFSAVGRMMDEKRPDLVHVWLPEVISIPVAYEAWKRGIPVISSIRRSTFKGVTGINLLRDALGLIPHFLSHHVVSNFSLEHEPWIVKKTVSRRPSTVIRNGLDCQVYGTERKRENENSSLRLCFVGRFASQKRLGFLIQTLGSWKDHPFSLDVFGKGSSQDESAMRALVVEQGLEERVKFHGFVKNWRVHAGALDVLVFPSVSEGMPNVLLEAMAEGLLVVASDIPEINCLVSGGENGLLFEKDEMKALLSILNEISTRFPHGIAERGRKFAQSFSVEKMASEYLELYNRCLGRNKAEDAG